MVLLYYILLLLCGILCFVYLAMFKIKEKSIYQNLSLSFALCLLLMIGGRIAWNTLSNFWNQENKSEKITKMIMEMGGFYLGRYISDLKIDIGRDKILIIDYPSDVKLYGSGYSSSVVEGIKRGVKNGCFSISAIENASAKLNAITWLSASEFDRIVKSHPEAGIVVCLVGLPSDIENTTINEIENPPRFIFFGGSLENFEEALRHQSVLAVVTPVPGKSASGREIPNMANIEKDFFDYFLLITPDTVKTTKKVFPALFKEGK